MHIANGFNNYFIDIPKILPSNIDISLTSQNFNNYLKNLPDQKHLFQFNVVDDNSEEAYTFQL